MLSCRVLTDNKLHKIERNAFWGLKNLRRLVLQNCGVKNLPIEAFEDVPSLTSL